MIRDGAVSTDVESPGIEEFGESRGFLSVVGKNEVSSGCVAVAKIWSVSNTPNQSSKRPYMGPRAKPEKHGPVLNSCMCLCASCTSSLM